MKIVYFYQYFTTPKGSYGTRVYEFARYWVEQGHEVTVVTSIYYKSDLKVDKLITDLEFEGIKVKALNVVINNKQPILQRMWTFLQYSLLSAWYAVTLPADLVIASSGPLTVGIPGLIARYLRRRKLVFEVRDLWPEVPIELGVLRNPLLKAATRWFEKACYRASKLIVALSPGMAQNIQARFGYKHVLSVPNSADNQLFGAPPIVWSYPDFVKGRKVALYAGNIGQVNNSELLLEAAKILKARGRDDLLIVLIGDGQQRDQLQQTAEKEQLDNFKIHPLLPKTDLVNWVQQATCCLVPLQDQPILDTSSPNKLFDALAAGIPVIQTTNGWLREFLDREHCGLTVSPTQPEDLANQLIRLADQPDLCREMGQNGRRIAD